MSKIGINGFGRIGRLVLRRLLETQDSNSVSSPPCNHTADSPAVRNL